MLIMKPISGLLSLSDLKDRLQPDISISLQAYARLSRVENEFNKVKFYCLIDDCNLPENCSFKLEEVQEGDRVVFPGSQTQYKLKPSEEFEPQVCSRAYDILKY